MNRPDETLLKERARGGDPEAMLALGQALLAKSRHGDPAENEGLEWIEAAARSGHPLAPLALGDFHSQRIVGPESLARAAAAYEVAAQANLPAALDRLGDLSLLGWGCPEDPVRALSLYEKTARLGYPVGFGHLAFCLEHGIGLPPHPDLARRARLWQAALAYPRGYFSAALDLTRNPPLDPAAAHALAGQASALGYPQSGDLLERCARELSFEQREASLELTGQLERHRSGFEAAVGALESRQAPELSRPGFLNDLAHEHWRRMIQKPTLALDPLPALGPLSDAGRTLPRSVTPTPAAVERSMSPHVYEYPDFLDPEILAHVMELVWHELGPASWKVKDTLSNENDAFSGEVAMLRLPQADVTIHWIAARVAVALGIPPERIEPFSVLRYRTGHRYAEHVDYFDDRRLAEYARSGDPGGQRVGTFLIYLRAPETGGETHYPETGLRVRGRPGLGVWHSNVRSDGQPDPQSRHEGSPIERGEKWLLRTAIRARPLYGVEPDSR
jgi:hypothetical protein